MLDFKLLKQENTLNELYETRNNHLKARIEEKDGMIAELKTAIVNLQQVVAHSLRVSWSHLRSYDEPVDRAFLECTCKETGYEAYSPARHRPF